jgi:hypothetical protein
MQSRDDESHFDAGCMHIAPPHQRNFIHAADLACSTPAVLFADVSSTWQIDFCITCNLQQAVTQ